MPQFLMEAKDHSDSEALQRRLAVRNLHITRMKIEKEKGIFIVGGAMLNDNNEMCGSVIILSMPDKSAVEHWVQKDPYIQNRVWNEITITPFRVADV